MKGHSCIILSIITITYDNIKGLSRTLESFILTENVEQIIINGGNDIETLEYLNNRSNKNTKIVSEPDHGIYDAMNKGLNMATGTYVIFMNAGDCFYQKISIKSIVSTLTDQHPDILYGETMYVNHEYQFLGLRSEITTRQLPQKLTWHSILNGMVVCHQSFIVKRTFAPNFIKNNLSADIDWMIKCLKKSNRTILHHEVIAQYLIGGVSKQNQIKSLFGRFKVMQNHFGLVQSIIAHLKFIFRFYDKKNRFHS